MFTVNMSITMAPHKNSAEKTSSLKHIHQDRLSQASWASHKKIRLTQKVIMVMMLHRGFMSHMVHKTHQLTWQMI